MKLEIEQKYSDFRSKHYASIGDQLDAIFKMAKSLKESGTELPEDVLLWIDDCQSVKDKYPKL